MESTLTPWAVSMPVHSDYAHNGIPGAGGNRTSGAGSVAPGGQSQRQRDHHEIPIVLLVLWGPDKMKSTIGK